MQKAESKAAEPVVNRASMLGLLWDRRQILAAAAMLAGLALLGGQAWKVVRAGLRDDPRYTITASTIEVTPPPAWVRGDVTREALRDANLTDGLSSLDPPRLLQQRLADALAFHPWVETVGAIRTAPPNRVFVEVAYRRPLAAVQMADQPEKLIAVDRDGVRLPSDRLTPVELRYLPRIVDVGSTALPGEVWRDGRVLGAVALVGALGEEWRALNLTSIMPSQSMRVSGELRYYGFALTTAGGTRIVWGAGPDVSPASERSFAQKLATLQQYVRRRGPLRSSYQTPSVIDLRQGLSITKRTAQKPPGERSADDERLRK